MLIYNLIYLCRHSGNIGCIFILTITKSDASTIKARLIPNDPNLIIFSNFKFIYNTLKSLFLKKINK
jgi:hypothetical protein